MFHRPVIQGQQSTHIDLHQALGTCAVLRCAAFVAMVKAADLRDSDDASIATCNDRARNRRVLLER